MKESRSISQILFGFLPEQTVDLRGGVWKVKDWRHPKVRNEIDSASLRREIIRQASPWSALGMDAGFVAHLHAGAPLSVLTLDENNGVEVEPFPKSWICKTCKRVHDRPDATCPCGAKGHKGQLFFVGYHDKCGTLRAPWIPKCSEHKQVRIVFPGTSSATEIRFECPVCNRELRKGFGFIPCECGQGHLSFQPHRASSVYTPRNVVIVNPPSRERIRAIAEAGGPPKALSWVVDGMKTKTVEEVPATREALKRQLEAQGLPLDIIDKMLDIAGSASGVVQSEDIVLSSGQREDAEAQAVTIALATMESRIRIDDLEEATESSSELGRLYRIGYREALSSAGLCSIDLIERFPVLTGHFGYTRGDHEPGRGRLVPYKGRHGQGYKVYADIAETEALFVRLEPMQVAKWLVDSGHSLTEWHDERTARAAILEAARLPSVTDEKDDSVGASLLNLVHSYAHRFLRISAVHAGIDRNALSELLVPLHLGFFIYAAARGDFVLGGLQAVFETELHSLLGAIVYDEHRCVLDPGCSDAGAACMACLHTGEPSCRYFNRYLSRLTLFGVNGYLRRS
ncbi:hypothetical protein J4G66_21980 [Aeromonas dhakensis]|uniref:hypothetical protein n=1 Tax=Aeromonas TaxID=642 RepID=UPI0012466134|nr:MULTISPECIES: hypothetical protein [Aeromonas]KAB0674572.1 hypothetical protein F3X86_01455 [Aeromonas veronii]MBS4718623.1 hypothetical protein [Aeromonas dhakensis]